MVEEIGQNNNTQQEQAKTGVFERLTGFLSDAINGRNNKDPIGMEAIPPEQLYSGVDERYASTERQSYQTYNMLPHGLGKDQTSKLSDKIKKEVNAITESWLDSVGIAATAAKGQKVGTEVSSGNSVGGRGPR